MNTKKVKTFSEEGYHLLTNTNNFDDDNIPIDKKTANERNDKTVIVSKVHNKTDSMPGSAPISNKRDLNRNLLIENRTTFTWQNQQLIVRNTSHHQHNNNKSSKYMTWSCRMLRRKQVICLIAVVLLILYVNSSLTRDNLDDRIPVLHYSHVPGMKEAIYNEIVEVAGNIGPNGLSIVSKDKIEALTQQKTVTMTNNQKIITNKNISIFPHQYFGDIIDANVTVLPQNKTFQIQTITATSFASDDVKIFVNEIDSTNISNPTNFSSPFPDHIPTNILLTTKLNNSTINMTNDTKNDNYNDNNNDNNKKTTLPKGYLVWSERCKMPNIDPYLPEVMKFFQREKYKPCSSIKPLTRVEFNNETQSYILHINEDSINSYSKAGLVDCCYQSIERNYTGISADKEISLSECIRFKKKVQLSLNIDNILVKCRVKNKQIYINGHPMMPERKDLRDRLNNWKNNENKKSRLHNSNVVANDPASVLMLGIDSISRINLIRAMPKTAQYLYDNEWFEMSGYNKVDDNTFPNLMAVLTGRNKTNAFHKCPPTVLHGLDNCSFVWNTFREYGYVTAYAEDEASINTFNYLKVGFEYPPVDFYLRPFLIAAEKHLQIKRKSNLIYCLGYKHSASFVYDYAIELASRFKHDPFFGLFWTNTFSHNAISDCSSMDEQMVEYLRKFSSLGTLNNTIVIFFSDHGMRFGPTRNTLSGHLEERLPFMFLWLPQHMKQAHPEFVNALSVNKNRLTNPYDLHMTLKHIISLSGRVKNQTHLEQAENCQRCQTLLEPVPHNRSCDDIAIEDHWCTCIPYQSVYKNSKIVHKLAKATVQYINNYVAKFRNGTYANLCVPLQFSNVENAYRAQQVTSSQARNCSIETYRIIFYTKPNKAVFEATVRYNVCTSAMDVTGEISRLNSYSSDSECVEDGGAKKYCSCRKKKLF